MVPGEGRVGTDGLYEGGSLMQLNTTREEGGGRASLEEQRPSDQQGTDFVDLLRSLDFIRAPVDETDLSQDLL